ncbi:PH domain-containing protein [Actinomadura roseirufa]|uniref:PH domain-containing protein n=1 Tax=Actinomadura roseirufa TaxID=2094049 RepID=UPI001A954DAD|nr:PH domain-containing protein [Actinomadura roseirufa]
MAEDTGTSARWRVPVKQVVAKCAAAVVVAVLAAASTGDVQRLLLAGVAAAGLAALALRDLLAPVRVAADREGVTVVAGYAGHRRVPWAEVTAIRVDERRRLLLHTRILEIETATGLHLFSGFDLGADVHDVAEALYRLRPHDAHR